MNHTASSAAGYSLSLKAAGTLAAKTSVSPDHMLSFTVSAFSADPAGTVRFIAQEKGTETLLYFDTEQSSSHQFTINLSLLEAQAEYKRKKIIAFSWNRPPKKSRSFLPS